MGRFTARDLLGGGSKIAKDYAAELPGKLADAVKKADAARKPAKVSFGCGKEDGLAFNRRFHMTDGSVGWNPGKKNPKIVRPAGPTDPGVPVVFVETDEKQPKPIAAYVNFAMHLDTVGGLHYSADYPYALAKALGAVKGDDFVTVFTTGTCGDINHINVDSDKPQKGNGEAARIGTRLAAEVLRTFDALDAHRRPAPRVERDGGTRAPARDRGGGVVREASPRGHREGNEAGPEVPRSGAGVQGGGRVRAARQTVPGGSAGHHARRRPRVGQPAGRNLRGVGHSNQGAASPFRQTMIAELANGSVGYVPNRVAYSQGEYEVVSARVAEGSGEKLVDAALKQLRTQYKK